MKVQELRIGNLVSFDGFTYKAKSIHLEGYVVLNDLMYSEVYINEIQTIKLTEEWLIHFGFFKSGSNFIIQGLKIWNLGQGFVCDKNGIIIEHVHQLQNLYFALTGKELKIILET